MIKKMLVNCGLKLTEVPVIGSCICLSAYAADVIRVNMLKSDHEKEQNMVNPGSLGLISKKSSEVIGNTRPENMNRNTDNFENNISNNLSLPNPSAH